MCVSFKIQVPASVTSCHRIKGLTVYVLSTPVQMSLEELVGGVFLSLFSQSKCN